MNWKNTWNWTERIIVLFWSQIWFNYRTKERLRSLSGSLSLEAIGVFLFHQVNWAITSEMPEPQFNLRMINQVWEPSSRMHIWSFNWRLFRILTTVLNFKHYFYRKLINSIKNIVIGIHLTYFYPNIQHKAYNALINGTSSLSKMLYLYDKMAYASGKGL